MILGSATSHRPDINLTPRYVIQQASSGASVKTNVSFDGVSWTQYSSSADAGVSGIVFGNNRFVRISQAASAGEHNAQMSTDGITWTDSNLTFVANQGTADIAFGAGAFVIVFATTATGAPNDFAYSFDGLSWTSSKLPDYKGGNDSRHISFGSGYFISPHIVGNSPYTNQIQISLNGYSWSNSTLPIYSSTWEGFSGNNLLFASKPSTAGYISSDQGATWSAGNMMIPTAYGNSVYLHQDIGGTDIYTSPNGTTWTLRTNTYLVRFIIFVNGSFLGVNNTGTTVATSTDGITWTALTTTAPSLSASCGIAYG